MVHPGKTAGRVRAHETPLEARRHLQADTHGHQAFDDFAAIASHVNHSNPGPDGVPYQAWLGSGGVPLRLVYAAYVALTERAIPPADFNAALLAFIPKGGPLLGTDGYEGKASQLHPLSLSNSCQKLITKALGAALEGIAMQVMHPAL